jgi:LPS-assembly protein
VSAAPKFGATPVETFDRPKECDRAGTVRQIATWELRQKAFFNPTFGGALIEGRRNVFTTTEGLTGIAFLTEPRTFSPIASRLRVFPTRRLDLQWSVDYDTKKGRLNDSIVIGEMRFGEIFFGGSHAFVRVPGEIFVVPGGTVPPTITLALANAPAPDRFNQFRILTGYGHPNKRGFSIAANTGVDSNFNFLQYGTIETSYNWQCIGLSVEYRRLALGVVRNENQFRFSLNLANIGTFGTLRRQESLF